MHMGFIRYIVTGGSQASQSQFRRRRRRQKAPNIAQARSLRRTGLPLPLLPFTRRGEWIGGIASVELVTRSLTLY